MRAIFMLTLALGIWTARAVTIDAVYFGQTHVLKPDNPYFGLVGSREALIKVHVTDPATPAAPAVTATLTLNGQNLVLPLTGPATLPASIPDGLGVVQHSYADSFTGIIPAAWVKKGLQVSVTAGAASASFPSLNVGAPTKVMMTMFDVQYFWDTNGDYPSGTFAEIEAKWPVASLEVRRLGHVIFPELVIPPRGGAKAVRLRSSSEYTVQTGLPFDGEQAAALVWNRALKFAGGRSGRYSLYYTNVYNAAAGGEAGGFAGVGNGTSVAVLHHELGHALSLPHWGDNAAYPYKGAMYGIQPPVNYNQTHAGPAWAFDLRTRSFIPPTTQAGNAGGKPVGTYKVDPMEGGGNGWQEPTYLMNHFSDYSVNQMRTYLHSHVVVWNPALGSYASWNQTTGDYTTTVTNNGVQFPVQRDVQVISVLASISGSKPDVNMVYPPIGPYTAGLIRLFDATNAADRALAKSIFSPANGSDVCVRVVQGGIQKTYMLAASWETAADPYAGSSVVTEAVNLPTADGSVTKVELLFTPDVQDNGLPANPQVLYTWAPLMPDTPTFESPPVAHSASAITMTATEGHTADGSSGTVEFLFTETTGNPGGSSSGWQSSRSYTDTGLQPGTSYSYTVSMRAGTLATVASAAVSAVTPAPVLNQNIAVNATQQFTLQSGTGVKAVTGLGAFNAAGADKLVVVVSTEDGFNSGNGYIFDVRYNGKLLTQAIQEEAGSAQGTVGIFYLDNPGAIGTGTIEVSADNPNGGIGAAYALSNTLPGFGASNSITGSAVNSVNLTTSGDRSLVIAVVENSGKPNSAGTAAATASLTQVSSGQWGSSQWGAHASGYRQVAAPSTVTPAFTIATGTGYSINIAAVEFLAKAAMPSVWTQTGGGAQNWTTGTNWSDSSVPNPVAGSTMDFGAVDILANTTLNLGADRTAQHWKFGDASGAQTWTVSAGQTMILDGYVPTIQVDTNTVQLDCVVAGAAGLTKTGAGTLMLRGSNTYTGGTTINAGTLALGGSNVLPATPISIGTATLNAATFTDAVGTLDVTGGAVINLGSGGALAFSDCSAVSWTSGTLTITGAFVSGSSLRFGANSNGLMSAQLALISKPGGGAVVLDSNGFLINAPANAYATWAAANAAGTTPAQDQDGDGLSNAVEFLVGGTAMTNDVAKVPVVATSGGNVLFTFRRDQASISPNTIVAIQVGATLLSWPETYTVGSDTATSSAGVSVVKGVPAGFDTVTLSVPQAPGAQKFLRLSVTVTP